MILRIDSFIDQFATTFTTQQDLQPWLIVETIPSIIRSMIDELDESYHVYNGIAIHKTAIIEEGAILKPPLLIRQEAFVGAHAYLRGGVYVGQRTKIGPGCEIKTSLLFNNTATAHFNFIGDSLIGSNVNFEAGALIANHYNERTGEDKLIKVRYNSETFQTNTLKFGALVGDDSKIGANAVLSPGTLLPKGSIVRRLELVDQLAT